MGQRPILARLRGLVLSAVIQVQRAKTQRQHLPPPLTFFLMAVLCGLPSAASIGVERAHRRAEQSLVIQKCPAAFWIRRGCGGRVYDGLFHPFFQAFSGFCYVNLILNKV